jgi:hypothetical protein
MCKNPDSTHLPCNDSSRHALMFGQCFFYLLEHVWMITNLPQLHDGVHQRLGTTTALEKRINFSKIF